MSTVDRRQWIATRVGYLRALLEQPGLPEHQRIAAEAELAALQAQNRARRPWGLLGRLRGRA